MSNTTLIAALTRIADMTDREGNPIEMHIEEMRGIARAALFTVEQKSSSDHLDYGGGGDPWFNPNSGPHKRYGG